MAERIIFIPSKNNTVVDEKYIEFDWHAGFSISQKQKSIKSLHNNACNSLGISKILEISSKSPDELGRHLSSFNLLLKNKQGLKAPVECFFQGSKVFQKGGPYTDLYSQKPINAKRDERLKNSANLIKFLFEDYSWPLIPQTIFYDWLYINALLQNPKLSNEILSYEAFTDIEFNHNKSINCQARSAAVFKFLHNKDLLEKALSGPSNFIDIFSQYTYEVKPVQVKLL